MAIGQLYKPDSIGDIQEMLEPFPASSSSQTFDLVFESKHYFIDQFNRVVGYESPILGWCLMKELIVLLAVVLHSQLIHCPCSLSPPSSSQDVTDCRTTGTGMR